MRQNSLVPILMTTFFALSGAVLADVVVPSGIAGLPTADAIAKVKAAGFEYYLLPEPSCSKAGTVSETRPPEGTIVSAHPPRVSLVVSQGGVDPNSAVMVPDVSRRTFVTAQQMLAEAGLNAIDRRLVPTVECPMGVPKLIDSVVKTDPKIGIAVCKGSDVFVYREVQQPSFDTSKGKKCP